MRVWFSVVFLTFLCFGKRGEKKSMTTSVSVVWGAKKLTVELAEDATLAQLKEALLAATGVAVQHQKLQVTFSSL